MRKRILLSTIVLLCAIGSAALASVRTMDWGFRAPSVSDPTAVSPKTEGDILYDITSHAHKGGMVQAGSHSELSCYSTYCGLTKFQLFDFTDR